MFLKYVYTTIQNSGISLDLKFCSEFASIHLQEYYYSGVNVILYHTRDWARLPVFLLNCSESIIMCLNAVKGKAYYRGYRILLNQTRQPSTSWHLPCLLVRSEIIFGVLLSMLCHLYPLLRLIQMPVPVKVHARRKIENQIPWQLAKSKPVICTTAPSYNSIKY